jgi:hypothetical protein
MTFQAYIDNIQAKTGKSPADFKKLADQKGFSTKGKLKPEVKAGQVVLPCGLLPPRLAGDATRSGLRPTGALSAEVSVRQGFAVFPTTSRKTENACRWECRMSPAHSRRSSARCLSSCNPWSTTTDFTYFLHDQ